MTSIQSSTIGSRGERHIVKDQHGSGTLTPTWPIAGSRLSIVWPGGSGIEGDYNHHFACSRGATNFQARKSEAFGTFRLRTL
ncbi:hypothetical protein BN1723_014866 [Verticillium longisporum]|uniref:Uncharacterized protein n=1 Tax=Verticillium longisporum TaxID=100787 RepID=A0A0G4MK25_VERLO|nr:hypothetical protein BN1723_014866 [Verticillium longisporum]